MAVADDPAGPWQKPGSPLLDVTPGSWDHLMVSNPSVAVRADGKVVMVYKGVGQGELPKGGAVVSGVAMSDHPLGPFEKVTGPVMVNPEHDWSVEDPYIWYQADRFYALVKDFHGYFTKTGESSIALFESTDGIEWNAAEHFLAFRKEIHWEDGNIEKVNALERPQLLFQDGKPSVLFCAVAVDKQREMTFNVHIPLSKK